MEREDLKGLTNKELEDIYWLISETKRLTGKDMEEEIITNYLLLDKLLKLDENSKEAKEIENKLLENMRRKLEEWEE